MEDEQVKEIINGLLKDTGKVWKSEEIEAYMKSYEIDNKTVIKILESLVDDFIFKWLDFISLKLAQVASEEGFVGLLRKIILRIKGDLAQGPFIRALINIGEENVNLGISLYEQMIGRKDEDLISYSSFPLGGAGKKNFDEAYSLIEKGLKSENPHLRTANIKALRVIFENETRLKRDSEIFEILDKFSSEDEDIIVQNEVLNAYVDFSRFRPEECSQHLVELAKRNDPRIRFNLANNLWLRNLPDKANEISILKICAEDEDENVLSRVSIALSKKGSEFPEESLEIIKDWIKRGKYFKVHDIEYCLKEIGKVHSDRCIKEVETWIGKEDGRLRFFIPIILKELSSSDYRQLIKSVETWASQNEDFWKMALQTIRAVLTEIFPPKADHESLVDSCFSILEAMVKEKNLDVEKTIHGEPDKVFQCFRLIEELELERKELNFEKILENLENYRAIRDFLGQKWFKSMEEEKNRTHPLLIFLSREPPSKEKVLEEAEAFHKEAEDWARYVRSLRIREMLWPSAFLKYLEEMLEIIVFKSKKLRDLKAGLRNEDQFWETLSEIEVISSFMRNYNVEIAPELSRKKLDAKVEIDESSLLFEVINPNMFKPLRYLTGKAIGIKNRARDKIYDEFKHHIRRIEIKENIPIVIVIDIGRSEISYDFVEDYLLGTRQLTMLFDKEKGKAIKTFPSRAMDYMHALEKGTDVLSAVICYKRYFGKEANFHIEGRVMLNAYAKNGLSLDITKKMERALFR